MGQSIVLGILFLIALFYLGRFIYRQVTADKNDGHCDKCLPKKSGDKSEIPS